MKLIRSSIITILVLSVMLPVQALSPENKVRLEGTAMCALAGLTAFVNYKTPDRGIRINRFQDGSIRRIEISGTGMSAGGKKIMQGMSMFIGAFGLYTIMCAKKIAEKRQPNNIRTA